MRLWQARARTWRAVADYVVAKDHVVRSCRTGARTERRRSATRPKPRRTEHLSVIGSSTVRTCCLTAVSSVVAGTWAASIEALGCDADIYDGK